MLLLKRWPTDFRPLPLRDVSVIAGVRHLIERGKSRVRNAAMVSDHFIAASERRRIDFGEAGPSKNAVGEEIVSFTLTAER